MNVFSRPNRHIILLLPLFALIAAVNPIQAQNLNSGNLATDAFTGFSNEAGYFVEKSILEDSFFYYQIVERTFQPAKVVSPFKVTEELFKKFEPITVPIQTYITEQKKGIMVQCEENPEKCSGTFEVINGLDEKDLADEIVKASYCFGTDPFMVTSKIRQESRFDMTAVSNTGAVGLTQLTSPGLKEILDQMGNRGSRYAFMDNKDFLISAIQCYVSQTEGDTVLDFPAINVVNTQNGGKEYTAETMRAIKAWVLPSRQHAKIANKKIYIQRQLFLGQVLLKIYLAYSKKLLPGQTTLKHYDAALRMFNGDDSRVQYAKEVIRFSRQATTL